jgi:DNA-binding Xre family transcriptional regulator
MEVNIRLKEVLRHKDLDYHGVINEIAEATGIERHRISSLYNNRTKKISLDVLGKITTWLERRGIRSNELLGTLFGTRPSKLWGVLCSKQSVNIYLGEYQQTKGPAAAWRWISSRDSSTASSIIRQLTAPKYKDALHPQFNFEQVPFRFDPESSEVSNKLLKEDIRRSEKIFEDMKTRRAGNASIIVGSQRVNYLLEHYISDLFNCKSFSMPTDEAKVPFFCVFRDTDRNIPSCFGGLENPYRRNDTSVPGLHYLAKKGRWITCPWKQLSRDAGVIITVHDPRIKSTEIAVFGFSGRATEAIGDELIYKEDLFWPPPVVIRGREIGIYICVLHFSKKGGQSTAQETVQTDKCEVIPLSERLLKEVLR